MTDQRYPPPDSGSHPLDEPIEDVPHTDASLADTPDDFAYPPPPPPRRPPPRNERSPWPMIIGVALLAILAGVMAFIVLGGEGDPDPSPSASASASASAAPSASGEPSPPASVAASASAAASAGSSPTALEIDSIVATSVGELSVREAPGTGATRLGSLALGTPAFVVAGPSSADGYQWYQLSGLGLPPNTGCAGPIETDPFNCPVWIGWVAAASLDGVPWLTDDAGDADECAPTPIEFEEIVIGVTDLMRLSCYGSDPFTYRAYWGELGENGVGGVCPSQDAPSGWLICQNLNQNFVAIGDDEASASIGLLVSIDPASGVTMPERGTWVELTVHLDDPAAQSCGEDVDESDAADRSAEEMVLFCRGQMVVETVTAVDGP